MNVTTLALVAVAASISCAPGAARAPAPVVPPPQVAVAPSTTTTCRPLRADERPPLLGGAPLVGLCEGVYIDPTSSPDERASVKRWYAEAVVGLTAFIGAGRDEPPMVIVCITDPCALAFSGPTRRSRAFLRPRPAVAINGIGELTRGTILHEMVHVAIDRRMGARVGQLPAWFGEGVAAFVGDNAPCSPGHERGIDDLRRLREGFAWENFTNIPRKMAPTYCQARQEIAAWVERRSGHALVEVIDAVTAGRAFDDVYGPLVNPAVSDGRGRFFDARFALDESSDTNGVDSTGRSHLASLVGSATWTKGHTGGGVKVIGGGYVRVDELLEYALPDTPFSVSLWEKPLTNAHVLIHTAMDASGGQGWCVPLLGHDDGGHLIAQVSFLPDPKAFLSATGPVLPLNQWSHVAVTWSVTDGLRIHVNGVAVASAMPRSAAERHREAPAAPVHLFFGGDNAGRCWSGSIEPGPWNGVLDELHVYNYALSPAEVLSDMRLSPGEPDSSAR